MVVSRARITAGDFLALVIIIIIIIIMFTKQSLTAHYGVSLYYAICSETFPALFAEQETFCGIWQLKLMRKTTNRLLLPAHNQTVYQLCENHC